MTIGPIPPEYVDEMERAAALISALRIETDPDAVRRILAESHPETLALALAQTLWIVLFTIAGLTDMDPDELWQSIALVNSAVIADGKRNAEE